MWSTVSAGGSAFPHSQQTSDAASTSARMRRHGRPVLPWPLALLTGFCFLVAFAGDEPTPDSVKLIPAVVEAFDLDWACGADRFGFAHVGDHRSGGWPLGEPPACWHPTAGCLVAPGHVPVIRIGRVRSVLIGRRCRRQGFGGGRQRGHDLRTRRLGTMSHVGAHELLCLRTRCRCCRRPSRCTMRAMRPSSSRPGSRYQLPRIGRQ